MQIADIPFNEHERLKTLHSLEILDTDTEERFDRLTRLAAHIFKVPISLVSFVDSNRQWFKSCVGLDVRETEREVSFCAHAINDQKNILVVEDATKDPRFHDNPLVTEAPNIRCYIGCTLSAPNGQKLGTLCIIDDKPRQFSLEDLSALEDLARMVEDELVNVQMALLDELTAISNYRGFVTLTEKSLNYCKRKQLRASIIFLDLNKFKLINDKFGHAEGDFALRTFAKVLTKTFRDSDVTARLGGDEFAVFLSDLPGEAIESTLTRFHNELEKETQQQRRGYGIGYSYGITKLINYDDTIEDLIERADKLMYKQKNALEGSQSIPD